MKSTRWALVALICSVAALPALAQTSKTRAAAPAPATRAARPAAGAQQLDGIAAVVNNEIVLQSDVEEQLYLFVMRNQLASRLHDGGHAAPADPRRDDQREAHLRRGRSARG